MVLAAKHFTVHLVATTHSSCILAATTLPYKNQISSKYLRNIPTKKTSLFVIEGKKLFRTLAQSMAKG